MEVSGLSSGLSLPSETVMRSLFDALVAEAVLVSQRSAAFVLMVMGCFLSDGTFLKLACVEHGAKMDDMER
ncbi:hypothetical protein DM860_004207 [Cuscuta australis]|uniref:Uncharacterized protein n=1 Tax=Cuscuta australis TaxID=267555 RepID=A0A328CVJ8_9ASTE|nr:hypothetical protein DM860_004207 [Cuscuta australis]